MDDRATQASAHESSSPAGARPANSGPPWTIRAYQPGDETPLVDLFARVFGRPLALEAWRWKLKGRPGPAENVWVATASDGRIIAQYAGIPVQVQLAGTVRPAMISVDTMTAPDFRRRGILTTLGQAIYATWAEAGVAAVLGLPNQQWGSRTDALGWVTLFPLGWQQAPLHIERSLAARLPAPLGRPAGLVGGAGTAVWQAARRLRHAAYGGPGGGIAVTPAAVAGPEFDTLWAQLRGRYESLLVRDRAWVAWRYLAAPGFDYRVLLARARGVPVGYVAYRLASAGGRLIGYLADLFIAPDDRATARALLGAALDDLWAQGAESARGPVPAGGPLATAWQQAGFRPAPGAFNFEVVPFAGCPPLATLGDAARWLLAGGDFDVV